MAPKRQRIGAAAAAGWRVRPVDAAAAKHRARAVEDRATGRAAAQLRPLRLRHLAEEETAGGEIEREGAEVDLGGARVGDPSVDDPRRRRAAAGGTGRADRAVVVAASRVGDLVLALGAERCPAVEGGVRQ